MLLLKVSSAEQVADSLTKSTPKPAFVKHRDTMMGINTLNDALVEDYDADLAAGDLDATGSDGRGELTSRPVTSSHDVTDDAALMAFSSNDKSRLCARGDYYVNWYNLRWIGFCLSTDQIDVRVAQANYHGNIEFG
eukprot:2716737-Rhodomonas_salina.1